MGDSAPQEGSELTNQPYRWDQRLFTILLRLPGIGEERNLTDLPGDSSYLLGEEALSAVSELTGGVACEGVGVWLMGWEALGCGQWVGLWVWLVWRRWSSSLEYDVVPFFPTYYLSSVAGVYPSAIMY